MRAGTRLSALGCPAHPGDPTPRRPGRRARHSRDVSPQQGAARGRPTGNRSAGPGRPTRRLGARARRPRTGTGRARARKFRRCGRGARPLPRPGSATRRSPRRTRGGARSGAKAGPTPARTASRSGGGIGVLKRRSGPLDAGRRWPWRAGGVERGQAGLCGLAEPFLGMAWPKAWLGRLCGRTGATRGRRRGGRTPRAMGSRRGCASG